METRPTNDAGRGARRPLGSLLRWCLMLAMLVAALAALAAALLVHHLDGTIRMHIQRHFARQFPQLEVAVRSARRVPGQGIEIRGISVTDPRRPPGQRELVYVDELLAVCSTNFQDLLRGEPPIERLEVRRLKVRAVRSEEGRWNLESLLPLPRLGACKPPAVIEDAAVEIQDLGNPAAGKFTVREINVHVTPQQAVFRRSDDSRGTDAGQPPPTTGREEFLELSGTLAGDHFQQVRLRGRIDPQSGAWSAQGRVEQLQMSSRLLAALPGDLASQLAPLATLRARAELDFSIHSSPEPSQPPQFVVSGRLMEGRFDDARLPYPLTDLRAEVHCDSRGLRIQQLTARSGRTTLELSFEGHGYTQDSPYTLRASARHLALDRRLYETVPAEWRETWDRYRLGGTVNVDALVRFDGRKLVPDVSVECLDLDFSLDTFTYPMRQGQGTIRLRDETLSTEDFRARAGAHWVYVRGRVERPGPGWSGWMEAHCDGPVPIDETLLSALDADSAKVLRALGPSGMVRLVHARQERADEQADVRQEMEIELSDVTVVFEGFPYPIHRIQGKLHQRDGQWTFRDLVGRNDSAYIVCDGRWTPDPDKAGRLTLEFDCRDVPLEDELKQALDPGAQQLWEALRPRGTIDQLGVTLDFDARRDNLRLDVRAQQWAARESPAARSLSLFPEYFPYRLDNVAGSVRYRDGVVEIHKLRAAHGRTQIQLAGQFESPRNAPWRLKLWELTADWLHPDRDLVAALPEGLKQGLSALQLQGLLSLRGAETPERPVPALELRGGGPGGQPLAAGWNLALDLENGSLDGGLNLKHVRGGMQLRGALDEQGFHSRGELRVDSALVEGLHVTRIRGPLWVDASRVLLGSPAAPGQSPRPITGRMFGGEVALVAQAALDQQRGFQVEAALQEADLAEIAREMMPRQRKLTGRANGRLELRGQAQRPHTFVGGGSIRLRNADIYELPVMVALLKLLSVRPPDTTAFTSSDIDFRVQGEDIYFDPIDFRGDAVSLIGKGWMDWEQNIELTFYTQVGRREFPLLGSVLAEASRNILEIQVVGKLHEPVVQQTAFPELDETLQMLFSDRRRSGEKWPVRARNASAPRSVKPPPRAPSPGEMR